MPTTIVRDADVDDDGSGFTGTVRDNAWKTQLYDRIDAALAALPVGGAAVVQTTTSTGTQNNFALTTGATFLRCNNATLLTLTGLSAGTDGQRLEIVSIGAGQVDLSNQAAGSTAGNRLINGVTGTISLAAGLGRAVLTYDLTTARWRVIEYEQGAWITRTFAAGNYTGFSAMTWTVTSVACDKYWLKGRTLFYSFDVDSTAGSIGGTRNAVLQIAIPGGFLLTGLNTAMCMVIDNGTKVAGYMTQGPSGQYTIMRIDEATWAASTNATGVRGTIASQVT